MIKNNRNLQYTYCPVGAVQSPLAARGLSGWVAAGITTPARLMRGMVNGTLPRPHICRPDRTEAAALLAVTQVVVRVVGYCTVVQYCTEYVGCVCWLSHIHTHWRTYVHITQPHAHGHTHAQNTHPHTYAYS